MRKLYFLLTALIVQCLSIGALAQTPTSVPGEPLITDVSQLSSNASDAEEGKNLGDLLDGDPNTYWHSDWHGQVGDPHYLQVSTTEPVSDGYLVVYFRRRNTPDNHLTRAKLSASADGKTWDDLDAEMVLTNPTAGAEFVSDAYALTKPYSYFRFTHLQTGGDPIFFHLAEFQLYHVAEADMAFDILERLLDKYMDYVGQDETALNVGTELGQFTDTETAKQILAALNQLNDWVANPEGTEGTPTTKAAAEAVRDNIEALFAKLHASEVLYKLPADGYYRIISNLTYKHDETVGEGEEAETVTTYMKKAMFCTTDYKGMWGTVKDDMANYLWKLTQTEDGIDMVNAGMNARFSLMSSSVTLSEDADKKVMFDFAGNENGHTVIYIREAGAARGAENYLHQYGHAQGLRIEDQPLSIWKGTFNMGAAYSSDKGTSEWYLEPVSDEEAQTMIEAFAPIKNHDQLVEQNTALRNEVKAAILKAKEQTKQALITDASQMSSPWGQNREGNSQDGGELADGVLLDGNVNTYWHSLYQNQPADLTGDPYIQLSGMDEMVGDIAFYIMRRATGEGHATEFTLKGSNDPEAAEENWATIKVIAAGNATSGAEFTSDIFSVDTPYPYVRVYATQTSVSGEGIHYFHAAELQIYKMVDNPNSQFANLGELATILEKIYKENISTDDADITIDMYNALKNAYDLFKGGMTDPTAMRNVLAQYANMSKAMVSGTNPGQWKDTEAFDAFNNFYKEIEDYNATGKYTQKQIDYYAVALPLAAKSFLAAANAPKTDTWYRIKFPSEQMYDDNKWNKDNISEGSADVKAPIWDNYVTAGEYKQAEGEAYYDYWATPLDSLRENSHLVGVENEMTEENPDASYFRFVEVESPIAPVAEFHNVMENSRLALKLASTETVGEPLIKNADQLSSNASDVNEGKVLAHLIDNDPATFWHSDYHNAVTAPHYLQVSFPEAVSGIIQVDMTRRANAENGDVTRMYVTGSNDGENWDKIGYIDLPFNKVGEQLTSTPIDLGGSYTNLRFIMTMRRGYPDAYRSDELDPFGKKCTYFHVAEFQIRPVTMTYASEAASALEKAMTEANKVVHKDLATSDYTALATAYNTLQQELNAGTHKVVPAAPVKPAAFVLQNKATGLFVYALGPNNHEVTLQLTPTILSHSALGYGENLLRVDNIDGLFCTYLHLQRNTHQLVTWDNFTAGTNSGLMLEEVEAAEEEPEFTFTKDIIYGKINAWCYPVAIATSEAEVVPYTVAGVFTDDDTQQTYLALDKAEGIEAGQPVLCIQGKPEDWKEATEEEPAEITPVEFTLSTKFNFQAGSKNGLVGTLAATHVDAGMMTFVNNTTQLIKDEKGADIAASTAYLDYANCPKIEAGEHDINILLTETTPDGISSTLKHVSRSGNIYTADGKLVRANGTLNDVNKLGRGLYIINGVKVLVK